MKKVKVETFHNAQALEDYLNRLLEFPDNRYDLRFVTEGPSGFVAVFLYIPLPPPAPVSSTPRTASGSVV